MEIRICNTCQGTGEIREDVGTHQSEYEYHVCSKCNGTGRVLSRSYSYCVPFDADRTQIRKFDAEIIDLIRKLESKTNKL